MAKPITSEILESATLTAVEKLVVIAIASHGEVAFPSQARLARLTSLNVRTVKRTVKRLRELGILSTHATRASLTYTVVMGGDTRPPAVTQSHRGGDTESPALVAQSHPNSQGNSQVNSPPLAPPKGGRRRLRREAMAGDPNWTPF
jgi:hypothetical protein